MGTGESSANRWRRADEQSQRAAEPDILLSRFVTARSTAASRKASAAKSANRYHERMWTVIATCGKQSRSFFAFLHNSIDANLTGQTAPSLLTD